jgi:outer membrane receptor for monomeric catechols
VPEHQASLWTNYAFSSGVAEGLSFGAGVRYIGSTYGGNANRIEVGGYTLFDAAIRYGLNDWQLAINASNLFDKEYNATCYSGACFYGGETGRDRCALGEFLSLCANGYGLSGRVALAFGQPWLALARSCHKWQ